MNFLCMLDMTWNDAIEAAAADCEHEAKGFQSHGTDNGYAHDKVLRQQADNIRRLKRQGRAP